MKGCIASILSLFVMLGSPIGMAAQEVNVTLGTGGVTGVYYPAGGAICRLVNMSRNNHGVRCSVESTSGSIYNLKAIRKGDLELAIVQSDWQNHAYTGDEVFQVDGADKELRSVFSVHPEPFTLVVRADSGIRSFDDLKGKRVNIGEIGSGQRATSEVLINIKGWQLSDFSMVGELKASEQATALCDDRLDAMVYVVGHPSGAIKEATTFCESLLISVEGKEIEHLIEEKPYYRKAVIPAGMYRGNHKDIKTFGVGATLVTKASVPDEIIYQLVKSVFENFDVFRSLHPALQGLNKSEMVEDALTAPLHPGALRYYQEVGLK